MAKVAKLIQITRITQFLFPSLSGALLPRVVHPGEALPRVLHVRQEGAPGLRHPGQAPARQPQHRHLRIQGRPGQRRRPQTAGTLQP